MRSRETLPSHMSLFNSVMEHIKSTRLFIFCINWCCSCKPSKLIFLHFYEMNLQTSNITITCKYNKKTHNQLKNVATSHKMNSQSSFKCFFKRTFTSQITRHFQLQALSVSVNFRTVNISLRTENNTSFFSWLIKAVT